MSKGIAAVVVAAIAAPSLLGVGAHAATTVTLGQGIDTIDTVNGIKSTTYSDASYVAVSAEGKIAGSSRFFAAGADAATGLDYSNSAIRNANNRQYASMDYEPGTLPRVYAGGANGVDVVYYYQNAWYTHTDVAGAAGSSTKGLAVNAVSRDSSILRFYVAYASGGVDLVYYNGNFNHWVTQDVSSATYLALDSEKSSVGNRVYGLRDNGQVDFGEYVGGTTNAFVTATVSSGAASYRAIAGGMSTVFEGNRFYEALAARADGTGLDLFVGNGVNDTSWDRFTVNTSDYAALTADEVTDNVFYGARLSGGIDKISYTLTAGGGAPTFTITPVSIAGSNTYIDLAGNPNAAGVIFAVPGAIPEPAGLAVCGLGALALLRRRRGDQ